MDKYLIPYGGRAGGAVAAHILVGRRLSGAAYFAALALGWVAGGLVADAFAPKA